MEREKTHIFPPLYCPASSDQLVVSKSIILVPLLICQAEQGTYAVHLFVPLCGLPSSPALTVLHCTLVFYLIIHLLNHGMNFSRDKTCYHKPHSRC